MAFPRIPSCWKRSLQARHLVHSIYQNPTRCKYVGLAPHWIGRTQAGYSSKRQSFDDKVGHTTSKDATQGAGLPHSPTSHKSDVVLRSIPIAQKLKSSVQALKKHEDIYTIPNILTGTRLIAAPVVGYLILNGDLQYALGLFAYAGVTDLVDGWIARRYKLQTVVGSVIDPMADKLLMTIVTVTLAVKGLLPGKVLSNDHYAQSLILYSVSRNPDPGARRFTSHRRTILSLRLAAGTEDLVEILGFLITKRRGAPYHCLESEYFPPISSGGKHPCFTSLGGKGRHWHVIGWEPQSGDGILPVSCGRHHFMERRELCIPKERSGYIGTR